MPTPEIKKKCDSDKTYNNGSKAHVIKKGETASKIAREHQVSLELLKKLNPKVDLGDIEVGDILVFKKVETQAPAKTSAKKPIETPEKTQNRAPVDLKIKFNCKSPADIAKATGLSKNYIDEIMKSESFKASVYNCDANKKTIGYGHRTNGDKRFNSKSKITKEQGMNILAEDLLKAKNDVKGAIGNTKLTTAQEEVLIDLVFNGGIGMIEGAPNLQKALKEGRMEDAACELDFIAVTENEDGKSVKRVSEGLCVRRLQNMEKFCGGVFTPKVAAKANLIQEKMLIAYDRRFKLQSTDKNREYILTRKDSSNTVVKELIQRCSKQPEAPAVKVQEKSTWQKIKDWWNS